MPIYLHARSLDSLRRRRGLNLAGLLALVWAEGFDGLEVDVRQCRHLDTGTRQALRDFCRRGGGDGLVLDIGADFTRNRETARRQELMAAMAGIRDAAALGVGRVRIAVGGQRLSVQHLRRRRGPERRSGVPGGHASDRAGRGRLGQVALRAAAWARRILPVRAAPDEKRLRRARDALRVIARAAESAGIRVGVENHWGVTARPEHLIGLIRAVGSPALGTCPDFGNFPAGVDAVAALRDLMPRAVLVHAKFPAGGRGDAGRWEVFRRRWRVCRDSGYTGPVTLEIEGGGDPLAVGRRMVQVIRDLPAGDGRFRAASASRPVPCPGPAGRGGRC